MGKGLNELDELRASRLSGSAAAAISRRKSRGNLKMNPSNQKTKKPKDQGQKNGRLFIDLCQDLMFKTYFSKDKPLLLSLLRAFLPLEKDSEVQDVKVLGPPRKREELIFLEDSARHPRFPNLKAIVVDLLVSLKSGEKINVEMQTASHPGFIKRIIYYLACIFSDILEEGGKYARLRPAYSLIFTAFPLFPDSDKPVHSFSFRLDEPPHFQLSGCLQLVFVDLSRFKGRELKDLVDIRDLWRYVLGRPQT